MKLEKVYLSSLQEQYSNTILIQIALLVVGVILAGVYIFFMLLPFMQEATTETRRCDSWAEIHPWVWAWVDVVGDTCE